MTHRFRKKYKSRLTAQKNHPLYFWESLRPSKPRVVLGGIAPRPLSSISLNMSLVGHDTFTTKGGFFERPVGFYKLLKIYGAICICF